MNAWVVLSYNFIFLNIFSNITRNKVKIFTNSDPGRITVKKEILRLINQISKES